MIEKHSKKTSVLVSNKMHKKRYLFRNFLRFYFLRELNFVLKRRQMNKLCGIIKIRG